VGAIDQREMRNLGRENCSEKKKEPCPEEEHKLEKKELGEVWEKCKQLIEEN